MVYQRIITDERSILLLSKAIPPLLNRRYNVLLYYAAPLLLWVINLCESKEFSEIKISKENIQASIRQFKSNIMKHIDNPKVVDSAVYCLCALLDETVMVIKTAQKDNEWQSISLLREFYQDSFGGEKFFCYINEALKDTKKSILLIEFFYFLLCLGYKGKYFRSENILNKIKTQLLDVMSEQLSGQTNRTVVRKNRLSIKMIVAVSIISIITIALVFNLAIYNKTKPIIKRLTQLEDAMLNKIALTNV